MGFAEATICLVMSISAGGGRRIAARVMVDQYDGGRGEFQRSIDHFTHIDRCVVQDALLLHLVSDDLVPLVQEENANLLFGLEPHRGAAIVKHALA